jgi:hypothetical protein
MSKEVSKFHPEDVVEVYEKFQNDENDVKGGKKSLTIKKKKARKTLKKPMFKRKSAKHK